VAVKNMCAVDRVNCWYYQQTISFLCPSSLHTSLMMIPWECVEWDITFYSFTQSGL